MTEPLDVEHQRRSRAERVVAMLQELWGDALPAGPHPELTVLIDAIAIDDDHASEHRLISQGDGLTYDTLAALLTCLTNPTHLTDPTPLSSGSMSPAVTSILARVPQDVLDTLTRLGLLNDAVAFRAPGAQDGAAPSLSRTDDQAQSVAPRAMDDLTVAGAFSADGVARARDGARDEARDEACDDAGFAARPLERVGMWEIDPQTRIVAYDAVTAQLMGMADQEAGYASVDEHLDQLVHPADRDRVEHALQYALRTETTYRVRFRVLPATGAAAGAATWLISQGRVLRKPTDPGARLTGYLILDSRTRTGFELLKHT